MKLRFLGGAGTVTGSRTLVTSGGTRVLVDCGLFQGLKHLRARNWKPLEVDPRSIDAVVLTHAHLDHAGWLPALARAGFSGPVYCTQGTADLLKILLPDAGRIQEDDAAYANRKHFTRHQPALPLYTEADANAVLQLLRPQDWDADVGVGPLRIGFQPAGHILGAASVRVFNTTTTVLFSGDLGRSTDLLMPPPSPPPQADTVVVESTYGDRLHTSGDVLTEIAEVVARTAGRGGVVLVPSFAVGRAQSVLWALRQLQEDGRIPEMPVILDSPMAVDTTELYLRHAEDLRLDPAEIRRLFRGVTLTRSVAESKALNDMDGPFVLVSSSGMLSGGRVLHHLSRLAPMRENGLLFVGYQAAGTRGARILHGESTVRVHGRDVDIRCEVAQVGGFSAHADQDELLGWLGQMPSLPQRVFVNHGEPEASDALRRSIVDELKWSAETAVEGIEWDLAPAGISDRRIAPAALPASNPAYVRADRDLDFLNSDELRGLRLQLEYMKAEKAFLAHDITGTVVIFGSARLGKTNGSTPRINAQLAARAHYYEMARELGRLVGTAETLGGERIAVCTGGGPGIMEAANRGAHDAGAPSIGLNITLPREQEPNPYVTPDLCFQFRYFAVRKFHFMRRARALVAFPGGYGTFDELYEALCLIQCGKVAPIPVVLVGREFWTKVMEARLLAEDGLIDPEDLEIFEIVDSAREGWTAIQRFYGDL